MANPESIVILAIILFPGVVGWWLLSRYAGDPLAHMAGWLTIMPYATTTIWIALIFLSWQIRSPYFALAGILPGALILIWIYWGHRQLIIGDGARFSGRLLFGLACMRWINSFFIGLLIASIYPIDFERGSGPFPSWGDISIIIGIIMPLLVAVVALTVVSQNAKIKRTYKHGELDDMAET